MGSHKRILISGGTGFVGSALIHELLYKRHSITLLTRDPIAASIQFSGKLRMISNLDELSDSEQFDIVINLAGASIVGGRWSSKRKQILLNSRLDVTESLLAFCRRAEHLPTTWIQASAIGYYGTNSQDNVNERSPVGNGFAAELCRQWEEKTEELYQLGIDRTVIRFGLVFGSSGGSLPMMLAPFRLGLGSIMGSGKQNLAWIHIEDLLCAIALCIKDSSLEGIVNAVAPDCPTHEEFALATGREMMRPVVLRIPETLLRRLLGEMSGLFVHGPRVAPNRLIEAGFNYRFADLRSALMDLT
ncbi:MAG: TIGR01777 family oxidoreductase [Gammaproteobacteria bacterium]|nr:TIGR01777 family oxidoreductase [Gammaproteobacteria bacterium]